MYHSSIVSYSSELQSTSKQVFQHNSRIIISTVVVQQASCMLDGAALIRRQRLRFPLLRSVLIIALAIEIIEMLSSGGKAVDTHS